MAKIQELLIFITGMQLMVNGLRVKNSLRKVYLLTINLALLLKFQMITSSNEYFKGDGNGVDSSLGIHFPLQWKPMARNLTFDSTELSIGPIVFH